MEKTAKKSGRNLNFLFIVGLILAIAIIIFAIQNGNNTEIDFFIWKITPGPPLALLIILCVAIGAVLALLFSIPGRWRRRKKRIQLESELSTLRKNYEELAGINKPKSNTP